MRVFLRVVRAAPLAFERMYLIWARTEMQRWKPMHPDLPHVILRINELERNV